MINLKNINCLKNDNKILDNISIDIGHQEKIAIIGPSGAGKTTLLNILSKHEEDFTGHIQFDGKDIKSFDSRSFANIVGIISQENTLIDNLKVINNTLAGKLKDWSFMKSLLSLFFPQERDLAMKALSSVQMADHYKKKTSTLSGGEKQRVAIARLLLQDPKVVLADEPIASLDPSLAKKSIELLVHTTKDKTLVMVLHHVEYALEYFDRIIAIKDGKLYFDMTTDNVDEKLLGDLYEL